MLACSPHSPGAALFTEKHSHPMRAGGCFISKTAMTGTVLRQVAKADLRTGLIGVK
jgi:hypothetical protein